MVKVHSMPSPGPYASFDSRASISFVTRDWDVLSSVTEGAGGLGVRSSGLEKLSNGLEKPSTLCTVSASRLSSAPHRSPLYARRSLKQVPQAVKNDAGIVSAEGNGKYVKGPQHYPTPTNET